MRGRTTSGGDVPPEQRSDYWGVVLEAPDPQALGEFYSRLLGWPIRSSGANGATLKPDDGVAYLAIQRAEIYDRPVWPPQPGTPHATMHLDFEVSDLQAAVANALELGAEQAEFQPQDNVRVMLDPAGHPFCLYVGSG